MGAASRQLRGTLSMHGVRRTAVFEKQLFLETAYQISRVSGKMHHPIEIDGF
jgi:hypothetical protein